MPNSRNPASDVRSSADADPGLRAYLERVYLKIAAGLALSAAVAAAIAGNSALRSLFFAVSNEGTVALTWAGLLLVVSPLLVMLAATFLVRDPTGSAAGPLFWVVAALTGGSLSLLSLTYTGAGLVSTFLVTAVAFAALSFWGVMTHENLRGLGSFFSIALFGLLLALIANLALISPVVNLVLNALGILLFSGLIASGTQRLKNVYYESPDPDVRGAISNFGALSLYLNFINLFLLLLSFGSRRLRR